MLAAAAMAHVPGWPHALQPLSELCCRAFSAAGTTHLGTSMPSPQSLDDILKVDQLRNKTPQEIEDIWLKVLVWTKLLRYIRPAHACAWQLALSRDF